MYTYVWITIFCTWLIPAMPFTHRISTVLPNSLLGYFINCQAWPFVLFFVHLSDDLISTVLLVLYVLLVGTYVCMLVLFYFFIWNLIWKCMTQILCMLLRYALSIKVHILLACDKLLLLIFIIQTLRTFKPWKYALFYEHLLELLNVAIHISCTCSYYY